MVYRTIIDLEKRQAVWVPLRSMDSAQIGKVTRADHYSLQWAKGAFASFFEF